MSDIDLLLLPRADLPVIWEDFKTKAELVRTTAETLTVTSITQKDEMALARKTRLTLREIRIAVEHKRVELGEGHLKEIQKVNGAARAIREFIEPLEARLLHQESFAERVEADRIAELSKSRNDELRALGQGICPKDLGTMEQADYDAYIAGVRSDKAEREAANRLRVEAESRLAVAQAETLAIYEASKATIELSQRVALEIKQKSEAETARRLAEAQVEAERQRKETAAILNAKLIAIGIESARQEASRQAEVEVQLGLLRLKQVEERARLDAERAVRDADLAEQKRIRDEQFAKLEAELKAERAAKQAEADAARRLALAPDVEKLLDFVARLQAVGRNCPVLTTKEAKDCFGRVVIKFNETLSIIQTFCRE